MPKTKIMTSYYRDLLYPGLRVIEGDEEIELEVDFKTDDLYLVNCRVYGVNRKRVLFSREELDNWDDARPKFKERVKAFMGIT